MLRHRLVRNLTQQQPRFSVQNLPAGLQLRLQVYAVSRHGSSDRVTLEGASLRAAENRMREGTGRLFTTGWTHAWLGHVKLNPAKRAFSEKSNGVLRQRWVWYFQRTRVDVRKKLQIFALLPYLNTFPQKIIPGVTGACAFAVTCPLNCRINCTSVIH